MSERYASVAGLDVALQGGVLRLTLARPDKRNAIDDTMMAALIDQLDEAGRDEDVRVIVLAGEGDSFCGGADIVARNAGDARPRVGSIQRRLPSQAHRLLPLVLRVQTPVVVRAQGWVSGIGCHLAVAADFCVADELARFWEPFSTRGFTPDSGGTWLLPRLIGPARAKSMLMLGEEVSGRQAADWGLIHRAVPAAELDAAIEALVERLASAATVAIGLTKWLVHESHGADIERHLAQEALAMELSSRSADFREGLTAFREKRDPEFEGR